MRSLPLWSVVAGRSEPPHESGANDKQGAGVTALQTALGRYPVTEALHSGAVARGAFGFADVSPISRAFAPMVRQGRYDVSELATATVLQAVAMGKPLVVLPVAVAARYQEQALLCRADRAITGPGDLRHGRIGVRSYSQTTGLWLRGIMADSEGISPKDISWIVFEGAHVVEYDDPPWVTRAPAGADMMEMLRQGRLDAVIVGNDVPEDTALRTVYPDPVAAGAQFLARYGFMPVNHMVVFRRSLLQHDPGLATKLMQAFQEARAAAPPGTAPLPIGREALQPVIRLAIRFAAEQGLIPPGLREEDVWQA